jgi:hypothetical protein
MTKLMPEANIQSLYNPQPPVIGSRQLLSLPFGVAVDTSKAYIKTLYLYSLLYLEYINFFY